MLHKFWLAKPYGLAYQKLCYVQVYKILEKKTKNVLENDWWLNRLISMNTVQQFHLTLPCLPFKRKDDACLFFLFVDCEASSITL